MDRISIEETSDDAELISTLWTKLEALSSCFRLRLMVVDSIGSPFRVCEGQGPVASRAATLHTIAAVLLRLAHRENCAVIVTNQVTTKPSPLFAHRQHQHRGLPGAAAGAPTATMRSAAGRSPQPAFCWRCAAPEAVTTAALGAAWRHCVHAALLLSRDMEGQQMEVEGGTEPTEGGPTTTKRRWATVRFAPSVSKARTAEFVVDNTGAAQPHSCA